MAIISIPGDAIRTRVAEIPRLLSVLVTNPNGGNPRRVACASTRRGGYLVHVAHDGLSDYKDYRAARFRCHKVDFTCSYFELWKPSDDRLSAFYLYRSYFSLYRTIRHDHTEREVVAVHCDPMEDMADEHGIYKAGPHLHVKWADHPIPRAHIALNRCDLDSVLLSAESMYSALHTALVMVNDQVISLDWT